MKKYLITGITCFCIVIAACKKSSHNPKQTNTASTCKLTSAILNATSNTPTTENFTYDAKNRLIKDSQGTSSFDFSYTDNKITIITAIDTKELTLENGRVISYSDNTGETGTITYNNDGYLDKITYYFNGVLDATDTRTYVNGNLTGYIETPSANNPQNPTLTETFAYDTTITASSFYEVSPLYYSTPFYIAGLYGKEPKGLLIKSSITYNTPNEPVNSVNNDFKYDKDPVTGNYSTITTHQIGTHDIRGKAVNFDFTNITKLSYACDK
ncbi:hypothetical protein KXD93_11635 [Mucilaginibacter sp. BJC16-A38]|uniref:hypothetical protein n=1 Tax=Mucilaginibacter phenanthrenivorans TaxID=1234842 RepID=UPI002157085F|nr:hypothetical protein [Mucilaginibacter phenanthrenivorans]MCR8558302.1 hypothetical protein [Mucilaginibacter phenanthrenivorans]